MTSKLSLLTAAASRTWTAGNKIPAQWMQADVAGAASWTLGGQGNRPLLSATNTSGVAISSSSWVDLTFDNPVDYDTGFSSPTYTTKTAGYYSVSLSPIPFGYPNPTGTPTYGLQYVLNGTAYILSYMPHASFSSISSGGNLYTMIPGASFTQYFNVNDTLKFQVRCTTGTFSIPASTVSGLARPTLSIAWISA